MKVKGKGRIIPLMANNIAPTPKKENRLAERLLMSFIGIGTWWSKKPPRSIFSQPNMRGSTDSSQRMVDFTKARQLGLPAGDVDRYPHRPWTATP